MLKRFLVFGGELDRPGGGWNDFLDSFDTLEQAKESIETARLGLKIGESDSLDWVDIVDGVEGVVVAELIAESRPHPNALSHAELSNLLHHHA